MGLILGFNIGLLVAVGLLSIYMVKENSKSMFFAMGQTIFIYCFTLLLPVLMVPLNAVLLGILMPNYFWLSFMPLWVPFLFTIGMVIFNWYGGRTYDKFVAFGDKFLVPAEKLGIDLRKEDIQVRFMGGKKVEYIFSVYSERDEAMTKAQSDKFQKVAQQAFPSYQIKVKADRKREPRNA